MVVNSTTEVEAQLSAEGETGEAPSKARRSSPRPSESSLSVLLLDTHIVLWWLAGVPWQTRDRRRLHPELKLPGIHATRPLFK